MQWLQCFGSAAQGLRIISFIFLLVLISNDGRKFLISQKYIIQRNIFFNWIKFLFCYTVLWKVQPFRKTKRGTTVIHISRKLIIITPPKLSIHPKITLLLCKRWLQRNKLQRSWKFKKAVSIVAQTPFLVLYSFFPQRF